MFVYGIRCAPCDLTYLSNATKGDYYMEYGLFVFPAYSKTTCYKSNGTLTDTFWRSVKRILEKPTQIHRVSLEEPYITENEEDVVNALNESYPGIAPGWYYCPVVA